MRRSGWVVGSHAGAGRPHLCIITIQQLRGANTPHRRLRRTRDDLVTIRILVLNQRRF